MSRPRHVTRLAGLILLVFAGCGRPPQLGDDRASFKAVDALYTAVSLRNPQHLDRCERVLRDLQTKGTLSAAASESLDAIIAEAKGGKWEESQVRLGAFMRGQRR